MFICKFILLKKKRKFIKKGHVFPLNPFPDSRKYMGIPQRKLHRPLPEKTRLMFSKGISPYKCYCKVACKNIANHKKTIITFNLSLICFLFVFDYTVLYIVYIV